MKKLKTLLSEIKARYTEGFYPMGEKPKAAKRSESFLLAGEFVEHLFGQTVADKLFGEEREPVETLQEKVQRLVDEGKYRAPIYVASETSGLG